MPARPDPASLSAWRLLLEAHATVTELLEHELVAERGLPLSRYDVLLRRGWFVAVLTDPDRSACAGPPRSTCAASTSTSPATSSPRRSRP